MIFLCYPKCSTCQKAKAWLDARGVSYTLRDIKLERPRWTSSGHGTAAAACPSSAFSTPAVCNTGLWS